MASKPCTYSNDNFELTNDSNDYVNLSNDANGTGSSGCDTESTTEDTVEEITTNPIVDGNIKSFISCKSNDAQDLTDAANVERIDLEYDYEIHTTPDADLDFSVHVFELDVLKALADEYGLSACEFGRRSLSTSPHNVIGVGSNPSDVKDPVYTKCTGETDLTGSSGNCTPYKGMMTAWVSKPLIRRHLSGESEMLYTSIENFSNSYTNYGGVLAIKYIGTRDEQVVQETEAMKFMDDEERDTTSSSSSSMPPGVIAGIAFATLAVLALLVAKKYRKKKEATEKREAKNIVNDALFMTYDMKAVNDRDVVSVATEDYTYDDTVAGSGTIDSNQSEDEPQEAGFEVNL